MLLQEGRGTAGDSMLRHQARVSPTPPLGSNHCLQFLCSLPSVPKLRGPWGHRSARQELHPGSSVCSGYLTLVWGSLPALNPNTAVGWGTDATWGKQEHQHPFPHNNGPAFPGWVLPHSRHAGVSASVLVSTSACRKMSTFKAQSI